MIVTSNECLIYTSTSNCGGLVSRILSKAATCGFS
jgi:hypothetical protein